MLSYYPELAILFLLMVANGAPVILTRLFGNLYNCPLDGYQNFLDGRPLFGPSKTVRGILAMLTATPLAGLLLSIPLQTGVLFALFVILGDLLSSFIKRRLGMNSSSMAPVIDQVPESLLPLLACKEVLGLNYQQIFWIVLAFFIGELIISRILYWLHIRKQPY